MEKTGRVIALIDCNSFFCSCERLFRPELRNRPVGVLSNNDGCFVSRTKELKALGVAMGAPYFKVKSICDKNNVAIFSSNFALYTNISDRVMNVLARFAPVIEIYSVDEAFLDLSGLQVDFLEYAREIRDTVYREVGIPVSVGIAPTKTLAKIANHIGKRSKKANGAVVLLEERLQNIALERVEVEDIWGIGRKNSLKLRNIGIRNALQFKNYKNEFQIQKIFTKLGRMTQDELRGIYCFELETIIEKKKEIMCSRSFGSNVISLNELRESVANYATSATKKMRAQGSSCAVIEVFCRSNPYAESHEQYAARSYHKFLSPTSDTRKVIKYALSILDDLFKLGIVYKKAGVCLSSFEDSDNYQRALFENADDEKSVTLMKVVDQINAREGYCAIHSMACGVDNKSWAMKREHLSPRYVTGWTELKKVH